MIFTVEISLLAVRRRVELLVDEVCAESTVLLEVVLDAVLEA